MRMGSGCTDLYMEKREKGVGRIASYNKTNTHRARDAERRNETQRSEGV